MREFLVAVQEALQAEAGAGELLEDITAARIYLYRAAREAGLPCIVIWPGVPGRRNLAAGDASYRLTRMSAEVHVYSLIGAERKIDTAAQEAEGLADDVERVLLDNRKLVGTTFGQGVFRTDKELEIEDFDYYSAILPEEGPAGRECYAVKVGVAGEIILRDGAIASG